MSAQFISGVRLWFIAVTAAVWCALAAPALADPIPITLAPSHFEGTVRAVGPNAITLDTAYGRLHALVPPARFRVVHGGQVAADRLTAGEIVRVDYPKIEGTLLGLSHQLLVVQTLNNLELAIPLAALPASTARHPVYARLASGEYVKIPLGMALYLTTQGATLLPALPVGAILAPNPDEYYGAYPDIDWYGGSWPYYWGLWWGYPGPYFYGGFHNRFGRFGHGGFVRGGNAGFGDGAANFHGGFGGFHGGGFHGGGFHGGGGGRR